jgi:hypothetical protein
LLDYIDLTMKKRFLRIRHENRNEQDVYEGAIDRPERQRLVRMKLRHGKTYTIGLIIQQLASII